MSEGRNNEADRIVPGDKVAPKGDKKPRKPRSAEVGRALRTVYDDTLRETVPDDFMDLLGKLS